MTEIIGIHAREILDSRGNPAVEVHVTLDDDATGRAAVPPERRPALTRLSSFATATGSDSRVRAS